VDRSINIVRQLEQVFDSDHMSFQEFKENRSRSYHNISVKKKTENTKTMIFRRLSFIREFSLFEGVYNLTLAKSEGRVYVGRV